MDQNITGLSLLPVHLTFAAFICTVNIINVVVFIRTPALRTIPNLYLISLAVNDIMTGLYVPSLSISLLFKSQNPWLCFSAFSAFIFVSFQSFLTITLIGMDRFIYIIYPFHYARRVTSFRTKTTIILSWFLSATVVVVGYPTVHWNGICNRLTTVTPTYLNCILVCFICLTTIVGVLYAVITRTALHQRNRIQVITLSHPNSVRSSSFKYIKLFFMVYVLFVLFWLPLFLVFIIRIVTGFYSTVSQRIALTLAFFNSGANFFVYILKNAEFRKALKKICACAYKANQVNTSSTNLSNGN